MKKTIIKLLFFNLLTFVLIFMANKNNSYAASNFTYTVKDNKATITSYKGTSGNVVIPSQIGKYKVTAIGNHAFDENRNSTNGKKMVNVVISEGITRIGDFAFVDCTNLVNIKLPKSLSYLGDQTFLRCTSLKKINIPYRVTTLGITGYMFQECGLESIIIPNNVTNIPIGTFRICKQLKKVIIYSPKATIDSDAFEYCSNSLVIQGYKGSTAQKFATQNGFKFVPITSNRTTTIPVKSIKLSKTNITLKKGQKLVLKPTILPNNATNKNVRWASSNSNIVAVKNGTLLGKQIGTAKIAVATIDGNFKAFVNVTVIDKETNTDNSNQNNNAANNTDNNNDINNNTQPSNSPDSTLETNNSPASGQDENDSYNNIDTDNPSESISPSDNANASTQTKEQNALKNSLSNTILNNIIFFIPVIIVFIVIFIGIIVFIIRNKKRNE